MRPGSDKKSHKIRGTLTIHCGPFWCCTAPIELIVAAVAISTNHQHCNAMVSILNQPYNHSLWLKIPSDVWDWSSKAIWRVLTVIWNYWWMDGYSLWVPAVQTMDILPPFFLWSTVGWIRIIFDRTLAIITTNMKKASPAGLVMLTMAILPSCHLDHDQGL